MASHSSRIKYHSCPELELGTIGHSQCVKDRIAKRKKYSIPVNDWDEEWETNDIQGQTELDYVRGKMYEQFIRYKEKEKRDRKHILKMGGYWDDDLGEEENMRYHNWDN